MRGEVHGRIADFGFPVDRLTQVIEAFLPLNFKPSVLFEDCDCSKIEKRVCACREETREARQKIEDLFACIQDFGFVSFSFGSFRVAFFHPSGWVLKIPYTAEGARMSAMEYNLLELVDEADRIYFSDSYLLIDSVEYAVTLQRRHDSDAIKYDTFRSHIEQIAKTYALKDIRSQNVGFDNNIIKFFDYAGCGT